MAKTTVEQQVTEVIGRVLIKDDEQVTPGSELFRDLEADSLDVAEIAVNLEEAFGIEIDDEDGEAMKTVKDVVEIVERKVAKLSSAA